MAHRIQGIESEVFFAALGPEQNRLDQGEMLSALSSQMRQEFRHMPSGSGAGFFLENGGRFYIDCDKPEITTPEVVTPWDVCRYVAAGEQILLKSARRVMAIKPSITDIIMARCNVGYGGDKVTWACHENYGHHVSPAILPKQMIPHFVSRIIYSGAGGFDNLSAGIRFLLSPRVPHLPQAVSAQSQHSRGIFHQKDETLSHGRAHRMHVLCGESNSSELSLWLKVATTTLVLALVESGGRPAATLEFSDAPTVMQVFAEDTTMTAEVNSTDRRRWTAIAIQEHYLNEVEKCVDHPCMPDWAAVACECWREVLEACKSNRPWLNTRIDWAIKLPIFQQFALTRGIDITSLGHWNHVLDQLQSAQVRLSSDDYSRSLTPALLSSRSPLKHEVKRLTPYLKRHGHSWDELECLLKLRADLCELDVRFGQLGEQGIFNQLDQQGLLDHHVEGVDNIEAAQRDPPSVGRARLRGECIKQAHGTGGSYLCDWEGVSDVNRQRTLDLSHPLTSEEKWIDMPVESPRRLRTPRQELQDFLRLVKTDYDCGNYENAAQGLEMAALRVPYSRELHRYYAWVQARRGFDGAERLDDLRGETEATPLWLVVDYLCVYRFAGLQPSDSFAGWLDQAEEMIPSGTGRNAVRIRSSELYRTYCEHKGVYLLSQNRLSEAKESLAQATIYSADTPSADHTTCRTLALLGNVYRRLGDLGKARHHIEQSHAVAVARRQSGDLAEFALTQLAKVDSDREEALQRLDKALSIQARLGHRMGEARILLLKARMDRAPDHNAQTKSRLEALRAQRPALEQCRLLTKVLSQWDEWTSGQPEPDESGDLYWGV